MAYLKKIPAMITGAVLSVGLLCGGISSDAAEPETVIPDGAAYSNGHYYMIYDDMQSFENISYELAERLCEGRGGHLATMSSAEENSALYGYIRQSGYDTAYIGMHFADGEWKWVNGESVDFTYWQEGEPNGNEAEPYCAYSISPGDGKWNDSKFNTSYCPYVCEWDSGTPLPECGIYDDSGQPVEPSGTGSFGESIYKVYNYGLTREEAAEFCINMGGSLAVIDSEEKQNFLTGLCRESGSKNMYWIDLVQTDPWDINTYKWDGEADLGYSNWTAGEPSNSDGDSIYAAMNMLEDKYAVGGWIAESNIGAEYSEPYYYTNYGFICEWRIVCSSDEGSFVYHSPSDWKITQSASCDHYGSKEMVCKRCGKTIDYADIPILSHKYEDKKLIADKFDIPGIRRRICTVCGKTKWEISANGIWIVPAILIFVIVWLAAAHSAKKEFMLRKRKGASGSGGSSQS